MFSRYKIHPPEDNENDTESWSFPSQYERFSAVNLPKSRLGKRRTIDGVGERKKGLPRGMPTLHDNGLNTDTEEFKNSFSQGPALTHPVTPSRRNVNKLDKYTLENESHQSTDNVNKDNFGTFTPFRKDGFYPLQEMDNFLGNQHLNGHSEKSNSLPLSTRGDLHGENNPNLDQMLKKSFEIKQNFVTDEVPSQTDSSNFDISNNSSFITAQDARSLNRSIVQLESKTPCKNFNLLDVLSSPINQRENFKICPSTPTFTYFDSFKTPFKSQVSAVEHRNEICTPTLLNVVKTPRIKLGTLPITNSALELDNSRTSLSLAHGSVIISPNIANPAVEGNCIQSELSDVSPSSIEDKMKTEMFEGLGWTELSISLKNQSLNVASVDISKDPNPECSSVLLTPNNSRSDSLYVGMDEYNVNSERLNSQSTVSKTENLNKLNQICQDSVIEPILCSHRSPDDSSDRTFKEGNESYNSVSNLEPYKSEVAPLAVKREDSPVKAILSCNANTTISYEKAKNNSCVALETSSTGTAGQTTVLTIQKNDCFELKGENNNYPNAAKETHNPQQNLSQEMKVSSSSTCNSELAKVQSVPHPLVTPPKPILDYQRHINQQSNVVFVNSKPYTVLSLLGKGGSSEVYQVLDGEHSKLMAMKSVNLSMVEDIIATGYLNEIKVLSKLQGCPSVIRMFDNEYVADSKILYVVMEKGDTDFSRLMKDIMKTKEISMSMILYYWTEMLNCVKDIHEKGIIHSDLKPANFLLVSGRLKLIDFGIASSLQGDMTSVLKDVTTGTFNYMSPEAIRNNGDTKGYKITYKSDIWSLGCILYNLLYGRTPFSHLTSTWVKLSTIADPGKNVSFPRNLSAPPNLIYSVRWALRKDPRERPTAKDLLKLAELTPGPETRLGRQISSLLSEYIQQTFPECNVKVDPNENEDENS